MPTEELKAEVLRLAKRIAEIRLALVELPELTGGRRAERMQRLRDRIALQEEQCDLLLELDRLIPDGEELPNGT